jgi:hypothetical protein
MAEAVGSVSRGRELALDGADTHVANEIANAGRGRFGPTPEQSLDWPAESAPALVAMWPFALVIAAALVVIDLVLRRLGAPVPRRAAFGTMSPDANALVR